MTTVERCRECGKLFPFLPRGVCRDCLEARERAYLRVRDWFRSNPGSSVGAASEANDVPVHTITGWIEEGRLQSRAVAADEATDALEREQRRREDIRRALAETVAATPPPAEGARTANPRTHHGMYGREH